MSESFEKEVQTQRVSSENILIIKDYLRAPIFASCKQNIGRTVIIKKENRIYEIGGFNPFYNSESQITYPAFDIRHLKAILIILSFREQNENDIDSKIRFSLKQFCVRYFGSVNSAGGRNMKIIKVLLEDLTHCWFRVTYSNKEELTYRVLKDVAIHAKPKRLKNNEKGIIQREIWLDHVELHPEFQKLLSNYTELIGINLNTFLSISSPLGQSLYAYMPSRALYRSAEDPFAITLFNLLKEIGYTEEAIPKHKSLRKKLFTQNKRSIVSQLEGMPFTNGILRTRLVETTNKTDYKLLFWNEEAKGKEKKVEKPIRTVAPNLRRAWIKSNRSIEVFEKKIANLRDINPYQEGLLTASKVIIKGNEVFIKQALTLLGDSCFDELAAEVKSLFLEPGKKIKHSTKFFIGLVLKAVSNNY